MLVESQLPVRFWTEAVASACYTLNRVLIVKRHGKTCFELLHKRKPDLGFLEPFGAPCTMIEPNGKFGAKAIEGFFLGYASPSRRVWNLTSKRIEEWGEVKVLRHTDPVRAPGDPWMFDYDGLFDSFNLPTFDDDNAIAQMLSESDNATTSGIARPIVVSPQVSSSVNNITPNEVFDDAVDYNMSSEDEEYVDAPDGTVPGPVQCTSDTTEPVTAPVVDEENASSSTHQNHEVIDEININNLRTDIQVPVIPETRIHNTHPQ